MVSQHSHKETEKKGKSFSIHHFNANTSLKKDVTFTLKSKENTEKLYGVKMNFTV